MDKFLISIVSGTFNESENIEVLYNRILKNISNYEGRYNFEIIVIDNASTDDTVVKLKNLAINDGRLKVIVNNRNFGHIRSPYWGILQAQGDAIIYLASDLQDPPELIPELISEWENGWQVVMAVKPRSQTGIFIYSLRKIYYRMLSQVADVPIVHDATGFGLYDKKVIDNIRNINDPYPFFRGLVSELGFPVKTISFEQPRRARGISKNNFYTLYDIAMLGIVSHSMLPLRLAGMTGFLMSVLSFIAGLVYLFLKLLNWHSFPIGMAPLVIGVFFLFGMLFAFIGLLGEYIGAIHNYLKKRPVVVEKERVNF